MVRVKKRYFVVHFEHAERMKKAETEFRSDGILAGKIKDKVEELFGDHGRASVTLGLMTIYANAATGLALICARHGPHRMVGAAIPLINDLEGEVKVIPRLVYTGATIRNSYKKMSEYQKRQLKQILKDPKLMKNLDQDKILALKKLY